MAYGDEHVFDPFSSNGGGYNESDYAPGEDPTSIHNGSNPYWPSPNSGDGGGEGYWGGPGVGPNPGTSVWTNDEDPGGWGNYNPNDPSGYFDDETNNQGPSGNTINANDYSSGSSPWDIDPTLAMLPAALAQAYKQWTDADKYSETAKEAMKYGDPFGQANREKYQRMFAETYDNPEKFLNDPGHQAKLKSGLDTVSRQDAMKGYMGSGNMAADLSAYTTNLNNQFLDQERGRLTPLMGAQFDPSKAGEFLMRGNEQSIAAKNAALGSIFSIFGRGVGQSNANKTPATIIQNNVGGGNASGGNAAGGRGTGGNSGGSGGSGGKFPTMPNPNFSMPPGSFRQMPLPGMPPNFERTPLGPDFNPGDEGPTGQVHVGTPYEAGQYGSGGYGDYDEYGNWTGETPWYDEFPAPGEGDGSFFGTWDF